MSTSWKGRVLFHRVLVLLCLAGGGSASLYEDGEGVELINTDSFPDIIMKADGAALVEFYTPGCGHCQALAPEYRRVARSLQGVATVAAVDCSQPSSRRLCEQNGVRGFPTLKVFSPERQRNPYTGEWYKESQVYTGDRSARAISSAVTSTLHADYIATIDSGAGLDALRADGGAGAGLATVLLFSTKPSTTALYKALSIRYRRRLAFAEARSTGGGGVAALAERLGVEEYPTLIVLEAATDGKDPKPVVYNGELKALPLSEFLAKFAAPEPAEPAGATQGGGAKAQPQGAEDPLKALLTPTIHDLTVQNLSAIDAGEAMWLVGFYKQEAEGAACTEQLAAARSLLSDVGEVVSLGLLNVAGAAAQQLSGYELDVAALLGDGGCDVQVVLFLAGEDKRDLDLYKRWQGQGQDAKALQAWVLEEVPDATQLLTNNHELQLFMATPSSEPGKAAGKVVLFATRQEVPGVYKALALQLRSSGARLTFGWIQPGTPFAKEAMAQVKVKKAPAMIAAVPVPDHMRPKGVPEGQLGIQPFVGPLKFPIMRQWLRGMATYSGLSDEALPGFEAEAPGAGGAAGSGGAAAGGGGGNGRVVAVEAPGELSKECYDASGICVLALLDGSSAGFQDDTATVQQIANAHAGQALNFVQVDARRQRGLRDALSVAAEQLPTLVALSAKRLRYSVMQPPFSSDAAGSWLGGVLGGRVVTTPLKQLPAIVEGGDDVAEEAVEVEEEFDLSDILAEEVDAKLGTKEEQLAAVDAELKAEAAEKAAKQAAKKKGSKKKKSSSKKKKKVVKPAKDEL